MRPGPPRSSTHTRAIGTIVYAPMTEFCVSRSPLLSVASGRAACAGIPSWRGRRVGRRALVSFIDKSDQRCLLLAQSAFPDFLVLAPGGKVLPRYRCSRRGKPMGGLRPASVSSTAHSSQILIRCGTRRSPGLVRRTSVATRREEITFAIMVLPFRISTTGVAFTTRRQRSSRSFLDGASDYSMRCRPG
jgi:hypothetical protein